MYRIHTDGKSKTIGSFVEVDYGNDFTYKETKDAWALSQGLKHEIDVLDGVRYANVKKTVAYVCVDEDADGNAVLDKWQIKQHRIFE